MLQNGGTLEESRDEKKIELCCALWKSDDETVMWVPNKKKPRQIPFGYQCAEERRPSRMTRLSAVNRGVPPE